ncbi:C-type lectin, mannose-binding protein [Anopheles darlingi]|uniref:C-type lectin, mannose-binding protein n=1 Tax=Anopheles darlingi TaxID=43151 RepID=W5JIP7_ANODA|nr:C-type lectin domain family 4 member K-like [Anopheles darlingi]ETN64257.1 C-type lectin, mannose-binding protein [Anopheles darlingi]
MVSRAILASMLLGLVVAQAHAQSPGLISGDRNIKEFLGRRNCLCSCNAMKDKQFYITMRDPADWYTAVSYCTSIGMEIAEVCSTSELRALQQTMQEEENSGEGLYYWIGANDLGKNGTYRWALTGRPVEEEVQQWAEGEPNNAQPNSDREETEHCVGVEVSSQKWNDFLCSEEKKFVCQRYPDN